jgi:hypothetical protein
MIAEDALTLLCLLAIAVGLWRLWPHTPRYERDDTRWPPEC